MGTAFKLSHAVLLPAKRITGGVQILLPEEGGSCGRLSRSKHPIFQSSACVAVCTEPAEVFFSGRTDVVLTKYQTLSTPDERGINPVRFCAKTDGF